MSDHPGPPSLSLALSSVVGAAMDGAGRAALLSVVEPDRRDGDQGAGVVPFPAPRPPLSDGPEAA